MAQYADHVARVSSLLAVFVQIKYGDTATSEGVLFVTYSALIGESQAGGQHRTRLKQILDWCEPEFDGVVSFTVGKKVYIKRERFLLLFYIEFYQENN